MATRKFSDEEIRLMVGYEWSIIREKAAHASTYYIDMGDVPPVRISREKRVLGRCSYGVHPDGSRYVKEIAITQFFANEADLRDTIRHEIAHALAYFSQTGRKHDAGWENAARFCGATPAACATNVALTEPQTKNAYLSVLCPRCPHGKQTIYRDGRSAKHWLNHGTGTCKACGFSGKFHVVKHREPVKVVRPAYAKPKEARPLPPDVPLVPEE